MDDTIRLLTRRYKTNCPFRIAEALGIHVRYRDLGEETRGLYFRKLRRRFIVIGSNLSEEWQRFVCAHELAHDRLHKGIGYYFIEGQTLFRPGKLERQANRFALKLLSHGTSPGEGETAEQYLVRLGIPAEMSEYL